jgi:hypothetical protein
MTIQDQIAQRIQAFTAELEALVRRAAIEAVADSLGGGPTRRQGGGGAAKAASAAPVRASRRAKGGKRPPAELAALVDATAAWIAANPGQGVEKMGKAIGVQTKELALPIAKLLKAKTIKKRGNKRATKYYPG